MTYTLWFGHRKGETGVSLARGSREELKRMATSHGHAGINLKEYARRWGNKIYFEIREHTSRQKKVDEFSVNFSVPKSNPSKRRATTKRVGMAWWRATSGKGSMRLAQALRKRMGFKYSTLHGKKNPYRRSLRGKRRNPPKHPVITAAQAKPGWIVETVSGYGKDAFGTGNIYQVSKRKFTESGQIRVWRNFKQGKFSLHPSTRVMRLKDYEGSF